MLVLLPALSSGQGDASCRAVPAAPRLDHAVVVVADLGPATDALQTLGFRFKEGRLHPDGLRNRHVKFRDGSGLELMTIEGTPASAMARAYASRLQRGASGVYAALWTDDIRQATDAVRAAGVEPVATIAGAWRFLSLSSRPDLDALFVGAGPLPARDAESVVAHENGALSLAAAWVESGPDLDRVLRGLGSRECGETRLPDGRVANRAGASPADLSSLRAPQ
jgi:hypothetical protein